MFLRCRNEFESVVFSFADQSHLSELKRRQMLRICGEGVGSFIGSPVVKNSRLTAIKE